jgi:VWFA-related protein
MARMIPAVLTLSVAAAALAGPDTFAQDTTFRSASRTVAIYATVTDQTGRLVPDLEEKHFEVYDNGAPRPLTVFKSDVQPIKVVVMLDTSFSMELNYDLLRLAAERFVLRLLPEDRARLGSFSDKIIISPEFTGDRDELVRTLHDDRIMQRGNPTHLWDAVDESMTALADEPDRRVVLVFTDGEDSRSRRTNFGEVSTRAQVEDFMIYAIGLQSDMPALRRTTRPDRNLRRIAEATGGGYFELTRTADLNSTFTRVADELHRQYVLGFAPEVLDGTMHTLDVRVKVPGMTVRARRSYLAEDTSGRSAAPAAPPGGTR